MSESNLEDCAAIHDLFTRYCCALDNGEIEAVVDCFTVDAILKSPVIHVTQPRLNDLLRGRVGKFSLDALVALAARAGLAVYMEITLAA
jgi:hypothetical protein